MRARFIGLAVAAAALLASRPTSARDDRLKFPIKNALEHGDSKMKLDPSIKMFFGSQRHPAETQNLGDFSTNKKTRAVGRSDQEACDWVFLSAVLQLQERARQLQANAVVDIKSMYKNQPFVSDTEYECGAGSIMSGVALNGRFVKLADK